MNALNSRYKKKTNNFYVELNSPKKLQTGFQQLHLHTDKKKSVHKLESAQEKESLLMTRKHTLKKKSYFM